MGQQRNFGKGTQTLNQQLNMLYDKKRELKVDTRSAGKNLTKTLRDAQKEFDSTGKHSEEMKKKIHDAVSKKVKLQFESESAVREVKDFEKNLKNMENEVDKVNKKKITPQFSSNTSSGGNSMSAFKTAAGVIGGLGIVNAGVDMAKGAINTGIYATSLAGQMEQTEMAYETMLKSQKAGKQMMSDLKNFAVATPFEFSDLSQTTQYALAMGFKQKDLLGLLKDAGDASSGIGKGEEGVENIIRALGQMQQKGKVSAEEINQLAENGIGAWGYIAKAIGKTTAETMKLSEKGLIPADKAILAIRKGMRQDYSGMMAKQSKTLLGVISNIKDFVNLNILGSFGEGIRMGILPSLNRFTDMLTNNGAGMKKFQDRIEGIGKSIGSFIGTNADKLLRYFNRLFNNKNFQNANFGGKIKIVLNDMYSSMKAWIDGEGGKKIKGFFSSMASNAINVLLTVATKFIPKFVELGLKFGSAMAQGVASSIADKALGEITDKQGKNFKVSASTTMFDAINHGRYLKQEAKKDGTYKPKKAQKYNSLGSALLGGLGDAFGDIKSQFSGMAKQRAFGVSRVPYNNYPIMAHEGEQLLTKQEANSRQGSAITVEKLADQIIVREEADINKFANELYKYSLNTGGAV
ncbi:MAG TPA: tape measure protein [Ruminiclostridium sp.]|nr:tape measure protein [Ruminiclostridium sp.]